MEEQRRLDQQRASLSKLAASLAKMPDRAQRDDMQTLRAQITVMREEMKQKEIRWKATEQRMQNQLNLMKSEKDELKAEVHAAEQVRFYRLPCWFLFTFVPFISVSMCFSLIDFFSA